MIAARWEVPLEEVDDTGQIVVVQGSADRFGSGLIDREHRRLLGLSVVAATRQALPGGPAKNSFGN